jgi:uncharacterized protein with HEPN domain
MTGSISGTSSTPSYLGVDLALVWTVVERDVPFLRTAVEALLT